MKYFKLIQRLALNQQNRSIFLNRRRCYVTQTDIQNQNDKTLNDVSSKKLETPPIISFSGIYRCSVEDPVSRLFLLLIQIFF